MNKYTPELLKKKLQRRKNKVPLIIKKLVVGQLQTNCYLVFDRSTSKAIIIDPGDDVDYIFQTIADLNLKPIKIIATHGHFDHLLAVKELKLAYKIPFLMHKKDEVFLKRMRRSCKFFNNFDPGPPPKVDKYLKEKDKLTIGHQSLDIIATPGHTPGSLSLYSNEANILFVGDLIFAGNGVGRTDSPYASQTDLKKSIKKILKLPKNTAVYSGHGQDFSLTKFKNPIII